MNDIDINTVRSVTLNEECELKEPLYLIHEENALNCCCARKDRAVQFLQKEQNETMFETHSIITSKYFYDIKRKTELLQKALENNLPIIIRNRAMGNSQTPELYIDIFDVKSISNIKTKIGNQPDIFKQLDLVLCNFNNSAQCNKFLEANGICDFEYRSCINIKLNQIYIPSEKELIKAQRRIDSANKNELKKKSLKSLYPEFNDVLMKRGFTFDYVEGRAYISPDIIKELLQEFVNELNATTLKMYPWKISIPKNTLNNKYLKNYINRVKIVAKKKGE